MLQPLITAALAPVLLLQGRRVRRTALELPEAAGPRQGSSGSGAPFRLLVLGDSAGAGVGVNHQDLAITGRLVQALSAQRTVHWQLVARSGHRLSQVIRAAQGLEKQATDLVVVSVGINDVLQGTPPERWARGLEQLAQVLQERCGPAQVAFSTIPRIQDFPLLPQPLAWYLGLRARGLNRVTRQTVAALPGDWKTVDLDLPLTADYLAHDGFHPNEAACALWCEQVLASLSVSSAEAFEGPGGSCAIRPLKADACPICGSPNECAVSACGSFDVNCWCAQVRIDQAVLARVPDAMKGSACVCRRCASGGKPG